MLSLAVYSVAMTLGISSILLCLAPEEFWTCSMILSQLIPYIRSHTSDPLHGFTHEDTYDLLFLLVGISHTLILTDDCASQHAAHLQVSPSLITPYPVYHELLDMALEAQLPQMPLVRRYISTSLAGSADSRRAHGQHSYFGLLRRARLTELLPVQLSHAVPSTAKPAED